MGILSEIRSLVKQAHVFPSVHKPEVYRQGANNIMRKGWGAFGAGAGIAKSIADRKWTVPIEPMTPMSPVTTVGEDRPEGSWGDYLRAGWNVGHDNADLMTAGMIEGAANLIPFVNFEAPSRYADRIRKMKIDNGMDPEDADAMRNGAVDAGELAASLPFWSVAGKTLNWAGRYMAPAIKADPASVGAMAENFGPLVYIAGQQVPKVVRAVKNGVKTVKKTYDYNKAQEAHRKLVGSITPENRQHYLNKSIDNFSPQSFMVAKGLGVSRDDFEKMFIDRNSLKMNVLRAPQIQRASLMKQYGFEQGDIERFAGRLSAMKQILDANEADQFGLMNRYGMYGDELELMFRIALNNQNQSLN